MKLIDNRVGRYRALIQLKECYVTGIGRPLVTGCEDRILPDKPSPARRAAEDRSRRMSIASLHLPNRESPRYRA